MSKRLNPVKMKSAYLWGGNDKLFSSLDRTPEISSALIMGNFA